MVPTDNLKTNENQEKHYYTIEQVATRTGFTKRTLRYYEELGLLLPTGRTVGNYRQYTESDIQRLEQIKNMRELLGFSLTDIRNILEAEDERDQIKAAYKQETDAAAKVAQLERANELISVQLQLIEQKLEGLDQMRTMMKTRIERHKQLIHDLSQNI
jgi:DNA-binding transcriptional MerR regulator